MATNIAEGWKSYDYIAVRAWYSGNTPATHCEFYCGSNLFVTDYYPSGSGSDTNWTTDYQIKDGLSPDTEYSFWARFRGSGGSILGVTSTIKIRTDRRLDPITPPTKLNISTTDTTAQLTWSGATGTIDYYEIYVDGYYIGKTSSTSYTVTELSSDTSYEFCVYACNDQDYDYICKDATTKSPSPPSPPSITNRFDGGIKLSWGQVSGTYQYTFQYKLDSSSTWTTIVTENNYCTLTDLKYATKYNFRVKSDVNNIYSSISSGHTLPKKPTISATNITHSSVTIRVNSLPDNCDKVEVECYVYSNGNYVFHSMKFIDPTGRTFPTAQTTTFTGLDRGWSYRFFAVSAYDANGDGTGTGTWLESYPSNEVTASTLNRPDNWAWITNFYSGKEYAVYYDTENYYYIMPATEWNSFLAKINEFRIYKDLSEVSFPTYVKDNYFTYTIYNQAVSAINAMSAYFIGYTTIPTKSSGSELTAADFARLRDTLNSID